MTTAKTGTKDCARCGTPFQPRRGGKVQRYCSRRCGWRTDNANRYARNRVGVLIQLRETMYGLSKGDFDRMVQAQNGVCAICSQPETSRLRGRLRLLSVDHDHKTGRIRGLLCNRCNRALGGFEDSRDLLMSAAGYLAWAEAA